MRKAKVQISDTTMISCTATIGQAQRASLACLKVTSHAAVQTARRSMAAPMLFRAASVAYCLSSIRSENSRSFMLLAARHQKPCWLHGRYILLRHASSGQTTCCKSPVGGHYCNDASHDQGGFNAAITPPSCAADIICRLSSVTYNERT